MVLGFMIFFIMNTIEHSSLPLILWIFWCQPENLQSPPWRSSEDTSENVLLQVPIKGASKGQHVKVMQ